jgi:hypothetical protein
MAKVGLCTLDNGQQFTLLDTMGNKHKPTMVWTVKESIRVYGQAERHTLCQSSLTGLHQAFPWAMDVYPFPE